jgi:acylphosphatase
LSGSIIGPETVCRKLVITGTVQGVTFRASTAREAMKYPGLRGYVRNMPGGEVEVMLQGSASAVEAMIEWCYRGPPAAQVDNVQTTECRVDPAMPYFTVRND